MDTSHHNPPSTEGIEPDRTTVANSEPVDSSPPTLLERLHRALGPLAGGMVIDFVDFATFGPPGVILGLVLGGMAGWWVSSIYRFGLLGRTVVATLAAIYCANPLIDLLPIATLVAAVARFFETPHPSQPHSES